MSRQYGLLADAFDAAQSLHPEPRVSRADPWKLVFAPGWTLVDRFQVNGRRYILMCETDPTRAVLSAREGQVLANAALGRSNKEIAYALGLADSTVRVLLARASRKLRASTRAELVQRFEALGDGEKQSGTCRSGPHESNQDGSSPPPRSDR